MIVDLVGWAMVVVAVAAVMVVGVVFVAAFVVGASVITDAIRHRTPHRLAGITFTAFVVHSLIATMGWHSIGWDAVRLASVMTIGAAVKALEWQATPPRGRHG